MSGAKHRAPRKWCIVCHRTLQGSAFRVHTGKKCLECFNKPQNNGPKVGDEFYGSKVTAAAERLILKMRAECGLR